MNAKKESGAQAGETCCKTAHRGNYPLVAPEYYNFAFDVVDKIGKEDRNKLAMIWVNQHGEEKKFTFHDLSKLSNQAANLLIKNGITRGDRVFLLLPRIPEWWIFSLALIKLGAIQCPSPGSADAERYPPAYPVRAFQNGDCRSGECGKGR